MKQRILYLDNVKAFAILLVMLGHALQYTIHDYTQCNTLNLIYTFHMPLFMMVSGYFFKSSLNLSFRPFLRKKSVAMLLPAFSWSLFKFALAGGGDFFVCMYGFFWFLKSVFCCYLACYIFVKFLKNEWAAYTILILLSILIDFHSKPLMLNYMIPCFISGIIYEKLACQIAKYKLPLFIGALLLFCTLLPFWKFGYYLDEAPFITGSFSSQIAIIVYRIIIGIAGSLAILLGLSWINKSTTFISFIGSSTLAFYVMNGLFSDVQRHVYMPGFTSELTALLFSVLLVIIQVPIYYLATKIFKRYKLPRLFLLGIK